MYSIFISVFSGVLIGLVLRLSDFSSTGWGIFWGVSFALAAYIGISIFLRKKLMSRMMDVQGIMVEGQQKLMKRAQMLQSRPTGNPQQMMKDLEKQQKQLISAALAATSGMEPLINWVPLLSRQIATMRMQFYYQMQEFDKVDELMPKCIFIEPISIAMRIAQMYRRKKTIAEIRKVFDKSLARVKYNKSYLIYGLMAWILLKEKHEDDAHHMMVEACRKNENDVLKANRDALANKKAKDFSNAGFGDEWYALFLEQPKINMKRQMPNRFGRPF